MILNMLWIILKLVFKRDFRLREKENKILKQQRRIHIINANIRATEEERKRFLAKEEDIENRKWQEKTLAMRNRIRAKKALFEEKGHRIFGKEL